jgi:hypothetical protein
MQCHESVDTCIVTWKGTYQPIPNAIVSAIAAAAKAGHAAPIDAERCCQADGLAAIAEFVEVAIDDEPLNLVVANAAVLTECDNVAVTDGDGWVGGGSGGTGQ